MHWTMAMCIWKWFKRSPCYICLLFIKVATPFPGFYMTLKRNCSCFKSPLIKINLLLKAATSVIQACTVAIKSEAVLIVEKCCLHACIMYPKTFLKHIQLYYGKKPALNHTKGYFQSFISFLSWFCDVSVLILFMTF